MTRITGLATGLDVDSVVQETMQAYQTKIDTVDQQKMVLELQQEMYREVIKDCRDFYDKYFNVGKSDSILLQRNWGTTTFESASSAVTVTSSGGAEAANYSVEVTSLAKAASYTMPVNDAKGTFYINNVKIEIGETKSPSEKVIAINEALKNSGVTAKYSEFSKGIVFTTDKLGADQSISISEAKTETKNGEFFKDLESKFNAITSDEDKKKFEIKVAGKNITVDLSEGFSQGKIEEAMKKEGVYVKQGENGEYTVSERGNEKNKVNGTNCEAIIYKDGEKYEVSGSNSNSITLDGVTFKFNNVTSEKVNITSKTDVTKAKDNIVKFVNDYNTLMEKLNTLISEKRDSSYMPLTNAQKEEMSEDEIKDWEKKAKQGILRNDSEMRRFMDSMQNAIFGDKMNILNEMGISTAEDYNKRGQISLDESKFTEALENDSQKVYKAFAGGSNSMMEKMKSTVKNYVGGASSVFAQKAGLEKTASVANNFYSEQLKRQADIIKNLKSKMYDKEDKLYLKFGNLESQMNKLNSQMNYFAQA